MIEGNNNNSNETNTTTTTNNNEINNNNKGNGQLKRKIEESNTENEFELKEFSVYKKHETIDDNNNNKEEEDEEGYSFDYTYNSSILNTSGSMNDPIDLDSDTEEDNNNNNNKSSDNIKSSLGLNTPIQRLSFNSPSFNNKQQQLFGSPMSISWNNNNNNNKSQPIVIPNSNNNNNSNNRLSFSGSFNESLNKQQDENILLQSSSSSITTTTAAAMKVLELDTTTISQTNNGSLTSSSPLKNTNPYEVDPVLKKQFLIEQEQMEKEKKEAMANNQPEIDHLIFIIHGIGSQNSENRVQTLEQNVLLLKKNCEFLQSRDSKKLNVDFQIIEWHSKLRANDLNENLEKISPTGVKKIRDFINETLLDVLLYMSPLYHQEILNEVSNQLNDGYSNFIERNPNFKGTVSIFSHSLGSVITWDLLSSQLPLQPIQQNVNGNGLKRSTGGIGGSLIQFKVENVFSCGSPVGMFLTIKNTPLGSLEMSKVLPGCSNWFNINSPTDAVAYRLEPFFNTKYLDYDPCTIEIEVEKKPLKQKLSGLFFKSTSTSVSTSPSKSETTTTTTTTTVNNNKEEQKQQAKETTSTMTTTLTTSTSSTPMDTTEIIDVDSGSSSSSSDDNTTPKQETKRRFKVHPLEPDSPTLYQIDDNNNVPIVKNTEPSSLKSKLLQTLSNVQRSMNGNSTNTTKKTSSLPSKIEPLPQPLPIQSQSTNNNNSNTTSTSPPTNNSSPPTTTTNTSPTNTSPTTSNTTIPIKVMIKESLLLSLSKESDSGFDKEEQRIDFNIEEGSSIWKNTGLPGASYIGSIYSHICYWESKPTALFIIKKLIHSTNKLSKSPINNSS